MKESVLYYIVRGFGFIIRILPLWFTLWIGKLIGMLVYLFDTKHKMQAYANLKMAFAHEKTPGEIKKITKKLFRNYGMNLIEMFRLPLLDQEKFGKFVRIEGKENVDKSLKEGKGLILLAMHFGSWELASLSCAFFEHPYKVIVKPQKRNTRLANLLNHYRSCNGNIVLSRGLGTRDFVKSLQNNEVIGMVVDQGGRDGMLVPFFNREASMWIGAIRMGLKWDVPICFSIIIREKGPNHRMIIHEPMKLIKTDNTKNDILENLKNVTKIMEQYIIAHPAEYMWFYKIWKYAKQANIVILSDGKTGHVRQSQSVSKMIQKALTDRDVESKVRVVKVVFKSKWIARIFSVISLLPFSIFYHGRLEFFKIFLTEKSYKQIISLKSDFIISCGSSIAGMNRLLSLDSNAKSVAVLKPGLLSYRHFDLVVMPQHDYSERVDYRTLVAVTSGSPNLISQEYLKEQSELLLSRYSHLKSRTRLRIGVLIGGDSDRVYLSLQQIRVLIHQLLGVAKTIGADLLVTTSRRTPAHIEQFLMKKCKKSGTCPLLIIANRGNVPEAVGGIMGLSDMLVVSGDSLSMISEAASSGKNTIVFSPRSRDLVLNRANKHMMFIEKLRQQGYIISADVKNIGQTISSMARNKTQTKILNDNQVILDVARYLI